MWPTEYLIAGGLHIQGHFITACHMKDLVLGSIYIRRIGILTGYVDFIVVHATMHF